MAAVGSAPRRLRVALVAPPWFEAPPVGYGGTETLCAELARGLTDRGHAVTLVGAGRSLTPAAFLPPMRCRRVTGSANRSPR